ncbi:hypothetical protein GGTG_07707 [Gaeumannomyces tritici R3-111a-1]|uniref:Uncharacterized protein n=1 Tax=Gaeumannomyces tritici (strain R3-111a-1) TaxID=644352 RepID=J3P2G0_GAET3|nr:hypothetical protein GGTG_07707 [Gaeumannomyces tritici R3-111a-1]EJT73852.1 hypothetical protein GGTG_07707 [Gaeumannomyces tritici R3-111a-1]
MRHLLEALAGAAGVAAQFDSDLHILGPSPDLREIIRNNGTARELLDGIGNPDASRSLAFKPFEWYDGAGGRPSANLSQVEWTWTKSPSRANPPRQGFNRTAVSDPHVVVTSFDLSWPGGGDISAALDGGGGGDNSTTAMPPAGPLCATALTGNDMRPNASNLLGPDDMGVVHCASVIGTDCLQALMASSPRASSPSLLLLLLLLTDALPPAPDGVGASCRQAEARGGQSDLQTIDLNPVNATERRRLRSGAAFLLAATAAFGGGAVAAGGGVYDDVATQLRVLVLDATRARAGLPGGPVRPANMQPAVLCMRVNAAALAVDEEGAAAGPGRRVSGLAMATAGMAVLLSLF